MPRLNRGEDRIDVVAGRPFVLDYVAADSSVDKDVRVEDVACEPNLRWLRGVLIIENYTKRKNPSWSAGQKPEPRQPEKGGREINKQGRGGVEE